MLNILKNRRPLLAMVAGSSLLLAGAAMPKICLHNSALMYLAGQAKLVLGDQEGALRLLSCAAEQQQGSNALQAKNAASTNQLQASTNSTITKTVTTRSESKPASPKVTLGSTTQEQPNVVFASYGPDPKKIAKLVEVAQLHRGEFPGNFDFSSLQAELDRAANHRAAAQKEYLRHEMKQVRMNLERNGVPVPPSVSSVITAPEAPTAP